MMILMILSIERKKIPTKHDYFQKSCPLKIGTNLLDKQNKNGIIKSGIPETQLKGL